MLPSHSMRFDGRILARGFWLYVWEIVHTAGRCYYIGRTGDSSSPHAQSPFVRVGEHLNSGANAKANSMAKQLRAAKIDPVACSFEMVGIGPIFPEQNTMAAHKPIRDRMSAVERDLAGFIRSRGYTVIGQHQSNAPAEPALLRQILDVIEARFPEIERPNPRQAPHLPN